jgi:hypothetical protein
LGLTGSTPGVAHRADQLASGNRVAYRHMLSVSMQYFVKKTVLVPDGYSADIALSGIFHNAGHRRAQRWIRKVDSRLSIRPDIVIEVDAAMRIC